MRKYKVEITEAMRNYFIAELFEDGESVSVATGKTKQKAIENAKEKFNASRKEIIELVPKKII